MSVSDLGLNNIGGIDTDSANAHAFVSRRYRNVHIQMMKCMM